jgi:hypothetical protein
MEKDEFREKRKYIRLDTDAKVEFQIQPKNPYKAISEKTSAIAKNLSIEGICFICDKKLEAGSVLKLFIYLKDLPEPLNLEGEVRWSQVIEEKKGEEKIATGVKLYTIPKSDESKFIRYISDKMTQSLSKHLHL